MPTPYYRDNLHFGADLERLPRVVRDLRDGVPDGPDVIREVLAVCSRNMDADLIVTALNFSEAQCICGDRRREHKHGTGPCLHNRPGDLTHGFEDCRAFCAATEQV